MAELVGACGLDCAGCLCYQATQVHDRATLAHLARQASPESGQAPLSASEMVCDGCLTAGRASSFCRQCAVRRCCQQRALESCAECDDFLCEKLVSVLAPLPAARLQLEEMRAFLVCVER